RTLPCRSLPPFAYLADIFHLADRVGKNCPCMGTYRPNLTKNARLVTAVVIKDTTISLARSVTTTQNRLSGASQSHPENGVGNQPSNGHLCRFAAARGWS